MVSTVLSMRVITKHVINPTIIKYETEKLFGKELIVLQHDATRKIETEMKKIETEMNEFLKSKSALLDAYYNVSENISKTNDELYTLFEGAQQMCERLKSMQEDFDKEIAALNPSK